MILELHRNKMRVKAIGTSRLTARLYSKMFLQRLDNDNKRIMIVIF